VLGADSERITVTEHNHSLRCIACEELQERERAARKIAAAANAAKEDFFLTLSHELRGPLNAIVSWVYLLRSGKLDAETTARALETIDRSATAEARLIGDMLDVSRIVGNKIRLVMREVDIAALAAEMIDTIRPMIDKAEIHVVIDSPRAVERITADPDRLRQVMENLLVNAVKFTPKGGSIVVRLGSDADNVFIAVADSGQGIRSELLPHVFERFRQSDATTTSLDGLGLGLAIVEHLVELHGGAVSAASAGEGQGATFTVTLPRRRATAGSSVQEVNP
jgi:signal transduction histidine kinase